MGDVFLSYRRQDSLSATGRLAERLQAAFGPSRVFRDLDSIAPGADFEAALERAIGGASVLLAVIGPRWLAAADGDGRRRLDAQDDVVRREIEAALDARVPVIPVLVEGAAMPAAAVLPASMQSFARCQAVELSESRWAYDSERLIDALAQRHGIEPLGRGAAGGPAAVTRRLGSLLLDLAELLVRPRRVLLRRTAQGGADEWLRAWGVLLVCLAFGNLLLGSVIEIGLAGFVLNGTLLGLVVALALSGLLTLAWRLGGVRAGWQRVASAAAYVLGGAWLYVSAGLFLVVLGVAMVDANAFQQMLALMRQGESGQQQFMQLVDQRMRGAALAAAILSITLWGAGAVWLVAAWRAMRVALGAGRWAAVIAALAAIGMLVALGAAARWAAGVA